MNLANLFLAYKAAIFEGSHTTVVQSNMETLLNSHFREFLQFPIFYKNNAELLRRSIDYIAEATISLSADTYRYSFKNTARLSAAVASDAGTTRSGVIVTIPDADANFLTTSRVAVGDNALISSVYYPIVEVSNTSIKVLDSSSVLTVGSAITYNITANPFSIIEVAFRSSSSDDYRTGKRTSQPLQNRLDEHVGVSEISQYRTLGADIEIDPYLETGNAKILYIPQPITFSSNVSGVTNPTNLSDDINVALAYFLASKRFKQEPYSPENLNQVNVLLAECNSKLRTAELAGIEAF